jgi:glycerol-3-phosphate cytidylyltransferase
MPEGTTGYLFGIFDLFQIAHLDTIRQAAASCERLIVGVASDELVQGTGGVQPFVPSIERIEIVRAVRMIAEVHPLDSLDLQAEAHRVGADLVFAPGDALDVVQLAALNNELSPPSGWSGLRLVQLTAGRQTTSSQVRAALGGSTTRSSVA